MRTLAPRVKETTSTTGTGTLSLDGPVAGFQSFVAGIGHLNKCYYTLLEGNNWEVGIGTVTAATPDTLSRDTVLASSNGGAKLNLGAGTKEVFCDAPAEGISEISYGSRGNASKNNATTPTTQFDLSADAVTLRNAEGATITIHAPTPVTNNISLDNTNANGRDQAGAFNASSWVHFYWVWGPTTGLRSRSSVTAPPTGPTLQTGETHWAYVGAVRLNASSQLLKTYFAGAWAFYEKAQNLVTSLAIQTTEQALSTAALAPPNALELQLNVYGYNVVSGGTYNSLLLIRHVTGQDFQTIQTVGSLAGEHVSFSSGFRMRASGTVYFVWTNAMNQAAGQTVIDVNGYKVPNGGE